MVVLALCVADLLACSSNIDGAESIRERCAGIQVLIHKVVVNASVKLVGSGSHRVIEVAAAGLSKFRRIVTGLDRNFLDRFNAGLHALVVLAVPPVGFVLAFNAEWLSGRRASPKPKQVVI